ncbi:MAG: NAD-dependent epimerase/dehydratase family protein [Burkholderiales bacterium]
MTRHVLITGANGYLGRALVRRLLETMPAALYTLVDLRFDDENGDAAVASNVQRVSGDLADVAVLAQATEQPPSLVFHLAGVTSRLAEADFALGLRANLGASVALFERLRAQARCPTLLFASSIGVFGPPLPQSIDDRTVPQPALSYGTQKRMLEILLADYSRRGFIDGRAVRLPGIVARPPEASGALSAFASDLIREPAAGRRYVCPVGPVATMWLLSLPRCIDALLQTVQVAPDRLPRSRVWNLPALRASAADVVQALGRHLGRDVSALVDYQPQAALLAQFAQWPPLDTAVAEALGQQHDGDLAQLIDHALKTA